jgi:hypothetical protein
LIEEAYERAGKPAMSGYHLRSTRRVIDLLTLEWSNRGLNLWTIEAGTQALTPGTATYTLPADTIDLIEHQLRTGSGTSQIDYDLRRISVSGYASLSNKNTTGRPSQIYIDRQRAAPTFTVWPVPETDSSYTLAYWRMRRIQDSGQATNTPDIPPRFMPAFVAALSFYIALKDPQLADRVPLLEQLYEKQFNLATEEDRSRASWHIRPHIPRVV